LRVAIIGAGIVGAAIADRLSLGGASVTLIDAGTPGRGTSATSLGWVNANRQPRPYFDFRVVAMRTWLEFAREFQQPSWYQPVGNLAWAVDAEARIELEARVDRLRTLGYEAHLVTPARMREIEPHVRLPTGTLAAHFPAEGYVEGSAAVDSIVDRARSRGVTVVVDDPVVAIDTRGGHVSAVRLARSRSAIDSDVVICCAGWRTGEVMRLVAADVRLVDAGSPGSRAPCAVAMTSPVAARPTGIVHSPAVHLRPSGRGVFLEASDIDATIDFQTTEADLVRAGEALLARASKVVPSLATARLRAVHRCTRPLPEDGFPIVGWHPALDGLYVAVTHSGVTLAPYLSSLVAQDILDGGAPPLEPYRPGRFMSAK
jgi:glycine/D-amino acid oxidase-like deaminating enzyme